MPGRRDRGLTVKKERFAHEYVKLGSPSEAYIAAYDTSKMKANTISSRANDLLNDVVVKKEIEKIRKRISERYKMEIADVFSRLVQIATADPNELVQFRRNNCRHCWGVGFESQLTKGEYAALCIKAFENNKPNPELPIGGIDFDKTRRPNSECPECRGEGVGEVFITDTRDLKGTAKLLYRGIKKTRDGSIEILMRDQDAALQSIAKYLGMFKQQVELTGKDGAPLTPLLQQIVDPVEAARVYQLVMEKKA